MEDKTIEKVDFSIEELETNYYECTFDKCNFSDKPIGRVIFEKCTFKECNLSLVKTSQPSEKSEVLPLRTGRVAYRIRNRSCRLTSPCITWE